MKKLKLTGILLLAAAAVLFLYVLFHETGHLIVMLSAGATVTDFSIFGAHVSGTGGNYTNISDLWLHANGTFLPLVLSYLVLLFYRSGRSSGLFYQSFFYFVALVPISSLLAWVFIPFLYQSGNAPVGDDVTQFLLNFSHPVLVSIAALLLIGAGVLLMVKKRIPQNFIKAVRETSSDS